MLSGNGRGPSEDDHAPSPAPVPSAPQFRCPEHPRRQLELFCRTCSTIVCVACTEGERRLCRQRWISEHGGETPEDTVFENLDETAQRMKNEVEDQGPLGVGALVGQAEHDLDFWGRVLAQRPQTLREQLHGVAVKVEVERRRLLDSVKNRCDVMIETLVDAAAGRMEGVRALVKDTKSKAAATQLVGKEALERLDALDVEQRPVEVVEACLSVMAQLESHVAASEAKQLLPEADLHVDLQGLCRAEDALKGGSWVDTIEVAAGVPSEPAADEHVDAPEPSSGPDPAKCVVAIFKPAHGKVVLGEKLWMELWVYDKDGTQASISKSDVAVRLLSEQPGDSVLLDEDRGVDVKAKMSGQLFQIRYTARNTEAVAGGIDHILQVLVMGQEVQGSPVRVRVTASRILTGPQDLGDLSDFLGGGRLRLQLCYRASSDGWSAAKFHGCCDGKGATVVVAKSTEGFIFGGYTSVPWSSPAVPHYVSDPSAFLFSITSAINTLPIKLPCAQPGRQSVFHTSQACAVFGAGHDLSFDNKECSCSVGCSYLLPPGLSRWFMTGSPTSGLSEVEVFAVVTQPAVDGQGPAGSPIGEEQQAGGAGWDTLGAPASAPLAIVVTGSAGRGGSSAAASPAGGSGRAGADSQPVKKKSALKRQQWRQQQQLRHQLRHQPHEPQEQPQQQQEVEEAEEEVKFSITGL